MFTVPGVIGGAQIGVFLANRINARLMGKVVGVLFLVLAVLTLMLVI